MSSDLRPKTQITEKSLWPIVGLMTKPWIKEGWVKFTQRDLIETGNTMQCNNPSVKRANVDTSKGKKQKQHHVTDS